MRLSVPRAHTTPVGRRLVGASSRLAWAVGSSGWLVIITAAAFLLRVVWQLKAGFYLQAEVWEYDAVARNVLEGRGYLYRFLDTDWITFATPAYPALLVVLHVLGGGPQGYWAIGIAQAAMSAGLAVAAYAIARQLVDSRAGLVAAAIVALHPGLVIYAAKVHELTFEALLAAIVVALALRAREPARRGRGLLLGAAVGLAALTRPTLAAFGAVTLAALAVRAPRKPIAVAALMAVALTFPWTMRNAIVLGTTGYAAPYSCLVLWMGNNPSAGGGTLARDGRSVFATMPSEMRERVLGRPELEQGLTFCAEGLRFMADDAGRALAWWGQKLVYFWWFAPQAGVFYPAGWIGAYRAAYALELALVLAGLAVLWRSGRREAIGIVAAQLVIVSLTQSFFYVEGRHRLMLEPTLAALAAAAVAGGVRALRAPRQSGRA